MNHSLRCKNAVIGKFFVYFRDIAVKIGENQ